MRLRLRSPRQKSALDDSGVTSGLTSTILAPAAAAQVASEAAGCTTLLVPATSITWQWVAARSAAASASGGSVSPNQTTPGLIIEPQAAQ